MQNKTSHLDNLMSQAFILIGQQNSGKTLMIQKMSQYQQYLEIEGKKFIFELVDTPSYDSYFTMLPMRKQNVTGYILIFSLFNSENVKILNEIRQKLFQINGEHKPTIVLCNTFQLYGINDSNNFEIEIDAVQKWCNNNSLNLRIIDLKNAKEEELKKILTLFYLRKKRVEWQVYLLLIIQILYAISLMIWGIYIAIERPDEIIQHWDQEAFIALTLGVGIFKNMFGGFAFIYKKLGQKSSILRVRKISLASVESYVPLISSCLVQ